MILIVGLGNPGKEYQCSRHNIGFVIADRLLDDIGTSGSPFTRFNSELNKLSFSGYKLLIAKPMTFMNNSGGAVSGIFKFHSEEIKRIIVIHDDLDIEFGSIKLKSGGGAGGHNGLESIIKGLKTRDFDRLRFGVGRPPGKKDPADFVLSDFRKAEIKELDHLVSLSVSAIKEYIVRGMDHAMNTYNSQDKNQNSNNSK